MIMQFSIYIGPKLKNYIFKTVQATPVCIYCWKAFNLLNGMDISIPDRGISVLYLAHNPVLSI